MMMARFLHQLVRVILFTILATIVAPVEALGQARSTAADARLAQCESDLSDTRRQLNECRASRTPTPVAHPRLSTLLPVISGTSARCPAGTAVQSLTFRPRRVATAGGEAEGLRVFVGCTPVGVGGAPVPAPSDALRREMTAIVDRLTRLEGRVTDAEREIDALCAPLSTQSGPAPADRLARCRNFHAEIERMNAAITALMARPGSAGGLTLAQVEEMMNRAVAGVFPMISCELHPEMPICNDLRDLRERPAPAGGSFAERIDVRPFVSGGVMIPLEARLGGVTAFGGAGACVDVGVNADRSIQVNACGGGGGGFNAAAGNAVGYGEYGLGMTYLARGSAVGFRAGFQGRHFATSPERFANVQQDTGGRGFSLNGRAEVLFRAGRLQIGVGAEVGGLLNTFSARMTSNGGREVTHQGSSPEVTPTVTLSIPILDRF